jgi:hypothetical protein
LHQLKYLNTFWQWKIYSNTYTWILIAQKLKCGEHILSWSILTKFYLELEMLPLALLCKKIHVQSLLFVLTWKKRSNLVKWEQKNLVELVSFGYLSLNLSGWTQKGWRVKTTRWQQLGWDVMGVHSEGWPNTRL